MTVTNPDTGHTMTLDEARDRYRSNPYDWDCITDYVMVASEYVRDNMIAPATYFAILHEVEAT
jgi:hypothetical protein